MAVSVSYSQGGSSYNASGNASPAATVTRVSGRTYFVIVSGLGLGSTPCTLPTPNVSTGEGVSAVTSAVGTGTNAGVPWLTRVWSFVASGSGSSTVTGGINSANAGGNYGVIHVVEAAGLVSVGNTATGTSTSTALNASITTTAANSIVLGARFNDTTRDAGSSDTVLAPPLLTAVNEIVVSKAVASAGATTVNFTLSGTSETSYVLVELRGESPSQNASAAASETASASATAAKTTAGAGAPSVTLSAESTAGLLRTGAAAPSITLQGAADAAVITTHNAEAAATATATATPATTLTRPIEAAATLTASAVATAAQDGGADGQLIAIGTARAKIEGETSPGFLYGSVVSTSLTS